MNERLVAEKALMMNTLKTLSELLGKAQIEVDVLSHLEVMPIKACQNLNRHVLDAGCIADILILKG